MVDFMYDRLGTFLDTHVLTILACIDFHQSVFCSSDSSVSFMGKVCFADACMHSQIGSMAGSFCRISI